MDEEYEQSSDETNVSSLKRKREIRRERKKKDKDNVITLDGYKREKEDKLSYGHFDTEDKFTVLKKEDKLNCGHFDTEDKFTVLKKEREIRRERKKKDKDNVITLDGYNREKED